MATTITVQVPTADSVLEPTFEAVAATMEFVNTGREVIYVKNGATEMIMTVTAQTQCSHGFTHSPQETISAGSTEERIGGKYEKGRFNDGDGKVQIAFSDATDGTIAVVRTPI